MVGLEQTELEPLIEGAIYRHRTGIACRDLLALSGPWQTVEKRHHRFSTDALPFHQGAVA